MADRLIKVQDLRTKAQQLLAKGKMPTPEEFAQAMNEAKADYVPKLKKIREEKA